MNVFLSPAQKLKLLLLTLVLSVFAASCSDDPAGSEEEPPEVPNFEQNFPDLSYFDNSSSSDTLNNYTSASLYATSLSMVLIYTQFYTGIITGIQQDQGTFNDGSWIWEEGYAAEGEASSFRIVATESADAVHWSMSRSFSDENSVEEHTMIEGEVSNDGNYSSWTFNNRDEESNEEVPALVSTMTRTSENEITIVTENFEDGVVIETYTYEQNGTEFSLALTGVEVDDNVLIAWSNETMTGYYQLGADERYCWDSNFADVNCD